MQTWAKRGIQSALVTGGLLMLGTGVASADENVSPDSPAGPLDLNVNIPIDIDQNAFGTPFGQYNVPAVHKEISTKPVTGKLNKAAQPVSKATAPASKALAPVKEVANKASNTAGQQLSKAAPRQELPVGSDPFKGNKVDLDVTAPIQITGNAIGIGGPAVVEGSQSSQEYSNHENTTTDGSGEALAGNAVVLDWALPVQISGNAGGVLGGSGSTSGSATQSVSETGNVTTSGEHGALSGNAGAAQFATPVQVTGNAVAGLIGNASSDFDAESEATSGGWIRSNGDNGFAAGNAVGGPLALPLRGNGNAVSALGGNTDAQSTSSADATAGDTKPGLNDIPAYIETTGNESVLSGNLVQPQGAGTGNLAGDAAAVLGNAATGNSAGSVAKAASGSNSSSETKAGGFSDTYGNHAVGSGNLVDAPVTGAGELFGIAGALGGNSQAQHDSTTEATAGDGTFASGEDAVLSGNTATAPLALAPEAFGIGGSAAGIADAVATEEKNLQSGGYNGTVGNDSAGSGNLVQVPVSGAPEVFGVGATALGLASGTAEETKRVKSGGDGNTEDDGAAGSSNLVAAPVSLPVQGFGIGGAAIGNAEGAAISDTMTEAGGDYHATGIAGAVAGNIVQAPVALPGQLHGIGLAGGGNATGTSDNLTDAVAGGDNDTDGTGGSIAGNIVQAPVGGALSAFGVGGAVGGNGTGLGANDVVVESGGDSTAAGDGGSIAGNVVGPQAMPIVQAFGDAASLGGNAIGVGDNITDVTTGGDITTSGEDGSLSGNIVDVPAAAVAQVFGAAATLGGNATGVASNQTDGVVGGETETAGNHKRGSGFDAQLPVGVLAQVYDVSAALLGQATSFASNETNIDVAGEKPLDLIISDKHIGATEVPSLPSMSSFSRSGLPTPQLPGADLPVGNLPVGELPVGELPVGNLPSADALDAGSISGDLLDGASLPAVPGLPTVPGLGDVPSLPSLPNVPQPAAQRADVPGGLQAPELNTLPVQLLPGDLPTAGDLPLDLPTAGNLPTGDLPIGDALTGNLPKGDLPTGNLPIGDALASDLVDLPSMDGVNVTPQADLPALAQLDSAPADLAGVADRFAGGFSGTPLDLR